MDKKDKKILLELILNSRISITQLAKKVGVSKEVALYRIKKLEKEKLILNFYTIINTEALGFTRYGFPIQLKGITNEKEKEFLDYLVKHPFVTYLGPIIGRWNIAFDVLAKDKEHLESIIKEITSKISKYLESYIITNIAGDPEVFDSKMLGLNKSQEYNKKISLQKIDEIDLKILREMSINSRIEYKKLSSKIKLTANAIKYRIKNLEKSGIISGYSISLDARKLNLEIYNLQIKQNWHEKESQLKTFLRTNSKVIYFYKNIGYENWDFDIGLAVKNSLELRDFIIELKKDFGNITKIHDIHTIVELSKGNITPEGVFKK